MDMWENSGGLPKIFSTGIEQIERVIRLFQASAIFHRVSGHLDTKYSIFSAESTRETVFVTSIVQIPLPSQLSVPLNGI
jgi:hypothetical protein